MNQKNSSSVSCVKDCTIKKIIIAAVTALAVCSVASMAVAEPVWTPSLGLLAEHDDNINFSRTEATDDYIYIIRPGLKLDYDQELTKIAVDGRASIRRYQDNDEYDNETYRFDLDSKSSLSERFKLRAKYNFIKDTTLDSELEETGRIFTREDRFSHDARLNPSFNVTERLSIGLSGRYRAVTYDSDTDVDYTVWDLRLPVRWNMTTEVDTIFFSPGYTYRDSDASNSKSYNFRVGWDHETTERLNLLSSVGARYTELERAGASNTENSWNAIAQIGMNYDYETGAITLDIQRDLRNTANGNQANVTRVIARLRLNFTERIALELNGRYYYTENEGDSTSTTTQYYTAGSELFYNLTEDHRLVIGYEYSQDDRDDVQNEPRAERNKIWAGVSFNFPMT
jgi:opacity protein-like surface antigen